MTSEKRPLPMTGEYRPAVYKYRVLDKEGEVIKYGTWNVLFRSEITYATSDWELAIFYALSLAHIWVDDSNA